MWNREFESEIEEINAGGGAIWVGPNGNDSKGKGTLFAPFATLTKAFALVTAIRNTIYVYPGTYGEVAMLIWPNFSCVKVIGLDSQGATEIANVNAATAVISINPRTLGESFEAYLENVNIEHDTQKGLLIDNAYMVTNKLLIGLNNVGFGQDVSGDSIHVDHSLTIEAIRIYATGRDTEIEGPVNITTKNAADRFRFTGFMLSGGLVTSNDDVASETTLKDCSWTAGAITGGHGNQKLNDIGCYTFDGTTYAAVTLSTTHANVNVKLT